MKKFTTLKTLLVGLLALGATSVWADNVTATLEHTAGAQWGSNTGASTVDAEKEHYNNDAASAWAGCAYAKFSFTIPEGHSITSATLTYSMNQGGKSGRNDIIYYMVKDFDLDWDNFAGQTGTDLRYTDDRADKAVAAAPTGGTGDRSNLSQDVTNAVKAIYGEGQNYILFQWTGNAGGADLYGKGSTKAPTLVIETANAASQTKYTVKFTDGTNDLKDAAEYDGTIGETVNASNDDKASFTNAEGTTKYIYESGAEAITLVGDASSNVITLVFREASQYSYTLWGRYGENSKALSTNYGFENDNITYYYPQFVLDGTTLYVKNKNSSNPYWGGTTTLGGNMTIDVNYTDGTIEDVVFYKEAEDMDGFTPKTTNNATIRCSNGTGGIVTEADALVELVTLPAGNYKIYGQVWGTNGLTAGVKANDKDVWTLASTGSLTTTNATFTLAEETTLYVYTTGGNDNHMLDYIYIQKMKAPFSYTVNYVDEENNVLDTNTQSGYEGETLNIAWNKYIKVDGQWYVTEAPYGGAYTETGSYNVVYKKADIYDFIELESTNYKSAGDTKDNKDASGGVGVLLAAGSAMATKEKIAAGTYNFSVYGFVRRANEDQLKVQISTDGTEWSDVTTLIFESSKPQTQTAYNVVLSENSYVRFLENTNQNTFHYFDYVVITETPSVVTVPVTSAGYATYCSEYDLDLTGIVAYTATQEGSQISFVGQAGNKVAAGTGLLIKKENGGDVTINVAKDGAKAVANNALIGVVASKTIDAGSFVLMGSPAVGFYKTTNKFTVGANTAYIAPLPAASVESAREFIAINGEATAIKAVETKQQNGEIYNLAGQRVNKAQKGLYIQNGKKVIIK